jgi:hypothetical protein
LVAWTLSFPQVQNDSEVACEPKKGRSAGRKIEMMTVEVWQERAEVRTRGLATGEP